MNRAFFNSGRGLVRRAKTFGNSSLRIVDVGCGSGLILEHLLREKLAFKEYLGVDPNPAGIELVLSRAKRWNCLESVKTQELTAQTLDRAMENNFDLAFSHFSLYLIPDRSERVIALKNIRNCLASGGRFFLALPMAGYSAKDICMECFKTELVDEDFPLPVKLLRATLLVPYQFLQVVKPIEARVKSGAFVGFTEAGIRDELKEAGFDVLETHSVYGGSGIHIIAIPSPILPE